MIFFFFFKRGLVANSPYIALAGLELVDQAGIEPTHVCLTLLPNASIKGMYDHVHLLCCGTMSCAQESPVLASQVM